MKKILCWGDSNTFGYRAQDGLRYDQKTRWSGILKDNLENYGEVIEFGLNNRAGFVENTDGVEFDTSKYIYEVVEKIKDIDILILSIGVNDLQARYDLDFEHVKKELEKLINFLKSKNIKPLIIPPPIIDERVLEGAFRVQFDEKSILKSKELTKIYIETSQKTNCAYFDFNEFCTPSDIDGLHYSAQSHKIIAQKLYEFILSKM